MFINDDTQAIHALRELIKALYNIGTKVFYNYGDRLFIHQFGDGFVIVSDFIEETPDRPVSISIVLLRHLLSRGFVCKASISAGEFGDYNGCYSDIIMKTTKNRCYFRIGRGVMTISPVIG